jgi:hypothetical protein
MTLDHWLATTGTSVNVRIVSGRGLDPAGMVWLGADVDELAVAATAVNSMIWRLGPRIVLYAGDILTQPNWPAVDFLKRL